MYSCVPAGDLLQEKKLDKMHEIASYFSGEVPTKGMATWVLISKGKKNEDEERNSNSGAISDASWRLTILKCAHPGNEKY
ncbi:hypothetical protein L2E82_30748 [Cichorium intybus]|uniref:Uncharacterized protein n=1 Tax=Cichorium intybus TaxID=13427 RepID=A0ACB9D1E3_CICIN|nr:hypothetical protein L2E82_30748 [Cichorium intybus]